MKEHRYRILVIVAASWLVLTPFLRAQFVAMATVCPLTVVLPRYAPEIAFGFAFLFLLPSLWRRKPWVQYVLAASALGLPLVAFTRGTFWLTFISSILLLILAYCARTSAPSSVSQAKRGYIRALMVVTNGPMFAATPGAYLQLTGGAVGALDGFRQGHDALAGLLLFLSLTGLYGLWCVWSVSSRLWSDGAYSPLRTVQRSRDLLGLGAAWAALVGFAAIADAIFRTFEVVALSIALGPALVLSSFVVLRRQERVAEESSGPAAIPLEAQASEVRALLGVLCGVSAALLGISYLIPSAPSGWTPCAWSILFPIEGHLWPMERGYVADGCATGLLYQTTMFAVASAVFWSAGVITTALGRTRQPPLSALAAALAASAALVYATLLRVHVDWLLTIAMALAVVAWAARLGYLGGLRGAGIADRQQPSADSAVEQSTEIEHSHARPAPVSWRRSLLRPAAVIVQSVAVCALASVIFTRVWEERAKLPTTPEGAAAAILTVQEQGDVARLSEHLMVQAFLEFCGEPELARQARPWFTETAPVRSAALANPLVKRWDFDSNLIAASMDGAAQAFRLGVLRGLIENGAGLSADLKEQMCQDRRRRFGEIEFVRFDLIGESPPNVRTAATSSALYDGIRHSIEDHVGRLSASLGPRIRSAALASVCNYRSVDYWLLRAKHLDELAVHEYADRFLNALSDEAATDEALLRAAFRASLGRHYDGYVRAVAALDHVGAPSGGAICSGYGGEPVGARSVTAASIDQSSKP